MTLSDLIAVGGFIVQLFTMVWLVMKATATSKSIEKDVEAMKQAGLRMEGLLMTHENRISLLEGRAKSG